MKYQLDEEKRSGLIQVETGDCDKEGLGTLCEEVIQKEQLNLCVAYTEDPAGCKFVVRSMSETTRADEVAGYLSESVGAGGGQMNKAGGFISQYLFQAEQQEYEKADGKIDYYNYLCKRLSQYLNEYQVIRAEEYCPELELMERYKKKKIKLGVVRTID